MRISYLLPAFGKTGGSIVLYNFMDQLTTRGYEIYAITPTTRLKWEYGIWKKIIEQNNNSALKSGLRKVKNIVESNVTKNERLNNTVTLYKLKKLTQGLIDNWIPSDITISTFCFTAYAGCYLAERSISLYHMQHFEEVFFQNHLERLIARNTYNFPITKISNSSWLKNIMNNYFNQESYLLNPGIDLNIFSHKTDYSNKYRNKKEWTIVSFFDETREWKGFNDAVLAVKKARTILSKEGISIKWKVFGLNAPTKKYDTDFEFVGKLFNENLAKLYNEADIVLLTSWYESFPLPPIEAMACGSLIITTKYGVEDYVTDGENGLVTLPRKIDDLTEKIVAAVTQPDITLELVSNGLKTSSQFSWDKRTDVLESILKDSSEKYDLSKYALFQDLVDGKFKEYMYGKFDI